MTSVEKKREYDKQYRRLVNGLFTKSYSTQRSSSKERGHPMPDYTKQELIDRFKNNKLFKFLYKYWVIMDYNKEHKPSFDRIDSKKPYTLDNLQVMFWVSNLKKGKLEKYKRSVIQYDLSGDVCDVYESIKEAGDISGVCDTNIWKCCKGIRNKAGGYIWKYVNN